MNLRPAQLEAHLQKPLAACYVLFGNEPLLVLEAADGIRAAARGQGFDERETLVVGQGFKWASLTLAAGNMSLFGGRKVIDLRIPTGKPGRDGGEALQRYATTLGSDSLTLITLPDLDWTTRKTTWFRAISEAGVTIELNAPERERLPDWIAARLARQNQSAPPDALRFIAEHIEGNLLAAHQEILKLGLLYPEGPLSGQDIETAVLNVARYDIDMLRQAVLEGDPVRCIRLIEGLEGEGAAPPLVLWALANEIRTLARLRQGQDDGQPLASLLKTERIFEDKRKQAIQRALTRLSSRALKAALLHAAKVDRVIKGLVDGDVWEEFLLLTLRLTRR